MRFITSASLGTQNISASLLTATYTATAVDAITTRLFAAGVSGSANYLAFVTLQRLGTGSTYQVIPVTSASVEQGTTAIALTTIPVPVDNTDVLKIYLQGSASDTTAPSLWTYFYGENTGSAYTDARGAKLDNLDVLLSTRVSGSAYTDARAAKLDNADAAISTRASASDWTSTRAGYVDVAISGRAVAGDAMTLIDSAITAAKISPSAFTNAKFAAGALTGNILSASLISASNIAGSAFGSSVFAGSAIDSTVFGATAASTVWNAAVRSLTDKISFGLSASTVDDIWNEVRSGHTTTGTFGKVSEWTSALAGAGSETVTISCVDASSNAVEGVAVWVTSDLAGTTTIAGTLYSNSSGQVTMYIDPGTFYVWRQGIQNWTNPQTIAVTDV